MNFFLHNPVADMPGPAFLVVYFVAVLLGAALVAWFARHSDSSALMRTPPIPPELDPLEIAYMRAGPKEVLRLVMLSLVQKGFLVFSDCKLSKSIVPFQPNSSTDLEQRVYEWFDASAAPVDLLKDQKMSDYVESVCAQYRENLEAQGLWLKKREQRSQWFAFAAILVAVELLGVYKTAVALLKGRSNLLFLWLFMAGALFLFFGLLSPGNFSERGKRFLDKLKTVIDPVFDLHHSHEDRLLRVGIHGLAITQGTQFASFAESAKMVAKSDPGECFWSCSGSSWNSGSSCGGGGGCGSGCGGCGS